jgi:formate hydrogenlyase transcriptional activator
VNDSTENNNGFTPSEAHILTLCALFEDEFSLDWIEELSLMKASAILAVLESAVEMKWLIRKKPAFYLFYDSEQKQKLLEGMSGNEKSQYNGHIADILLRDLPDSDRKLELVATHLLYTSFDWSGFDWLMRAGKHYAKTLQADLAITCFDRILTDLSARHAERDNQLFIEAALEHSNVFAGRSDVKKSMSYLIEAKERVKSLHFKPYEILLEMHIAKYERLSARFNLGLKRFERAFKEAEEYGDRELLSVVTMFHTYFLFWQGRFREVVDVYERSVPEVDRYPVGPFPLIAAMMVGHCYGMTGQPTQGLGMLDTIRNYCLEKGDLYLSAHAGVCIAMVMLCINHIEEAAEYSHLALKEAQKGNNRWVATITIIILALASYLKGDNKEYFRYLRLFDRKKGTLNPSSVLIPYLLEMGFIIEKSNMSYASSISVHKNIEDALQQRNVFLKGLALRYKALDLAYETPPGQTASIGQTSSIRQTVPGRQTAHSQQVVSKRELVRLFTQSITHLKSSGNRPELGKTYCEFARFYLAIKNKKRAKAMAKMASEKLIPLNPTLIPDDLKMIMGTENTDLAVLEGILDLGQYMGTGRDGGKTLQRIVTSANRLIGAERAALLLRESGEISDLQLRASKSLTIEDVDDKAFAPAYEIISDVLTKGAGRITETLPSSDGAARSSGAVRSSICVPLISMGNTIGVLYHENRLLTNRFNEHHLKILSFFAGLAVLTIEAEKSREYSAKADHGHVMVHGLPLQEDTTGSVSVEGIVGSSAAMGKILAQISEVAQTDIPVLILGETGVGKNMLAEGIHKRSARHDGPFVTVQCSALTESLITSELFGHEKGAFTGATDRQIGRFERAHGGTLFLDEIGDLSLDVQARLLRVLQTKEFERVGGGKNTLVSDFRLVAATNKNLEEEVRAKRFREDLYYRINVLPLVVPPLRHRKEDIPSLAYHFMKVYGTLHQSRVTIIPQDAMDVLTTYNWPGNIRELENVIQRALLMSKGPELRLPSLQTVEDNSKGGQRQGFKSMEEIERDHIEQVLDARGGKIRGPNGAAVVLGLNSSTLRSRMKKLGITRWRKSKEGSWKR